jgi:hypothetical protein
VQQIVDAYEREESWPDRPAPRTRREADTEARDPVAPPPSEAASETASEAPEGGEPEAPESTS